LTVEKKIGFYTRPADHVSEENVNENVGSSKLHRGCLNTLFWSN